MSDSKFKCIEVTGRIRLEKVSHKLPVWSSRIMLVGVTGSGKSNFLECLADDKTLGLSKNQLESVTQSIECYRVVNVKKKSNIGINGEIYLIDTPGFSDRKMSEKKIVSMLHEWAGASMDNLGLAADRAIYFERITDPRMSGSKKRAKEIFQMITGERTERRVTIATTMWDTLWNDEQRDKAEKRFEEYSSSCWENFTSNGTRCVKFENTQQSALSVLNLVYDNKATIDSFVFTRPPYTGPNLYKAPYAPYILERLQERISLLEGRLRVITDDLSSQESIEAGGDSEYVQQLLEDKADIGGLLVEARGEMTNFGAPISESDEVVIKPSVRRRFLNWVSDMF
ncbi:hypothetical protein BJ165DRAFT_1518977 [Panaeolus papilionaceus]|nr:hypothetical protein BJ165DRAFT_1518977 [Panaeolus papilionaceus]